MRPVPARRSVLIELRGVTRTFGTATTAVHAIRDASVTVRAGDFIAVTGVSGSGKSTLLNVLGLLDEPSTGSYLLDGIDTALRSDTARAELRARTIGFVFQDARLIAHRTVTENVTVGLLYGRGCARRDRARLASQALERVGMTHRADAMPETLSGGERQRVAIARALAKRPPLLLADEPTGNLDTANTDAILQLFTDLNRDGHAVIVVTHESYVATHCARQLHMRDGILTEPARASSL